MGANPQRIIGKNRLTKLQKTAIVRTITAITGVRILVEILKLSPKVMEDVEAVVVVVAIEEAKHLMVHQPAEQTTPTTPTQVTTARIPASIVIR